MIYNISAERLVGVGWALDSGDSLVLVGLQVTTTRMEVQALSINQSEAYLISGYCTVSTTVACTYNIGPKIYTFTFRED
jgi:hypothetical protein